MSYMSYILGDESILNPVSANGGNVDTIQVVPDGPGIAPSGDRAIPISVIPTKARLYLEDQLHLVNNSFSAQDTDKELLVRCSFSYSDKKLNIILRNYNKMEKKQSKIDKKDSKSLKEKDIEIGDIVREVKGKFTAKITEFEKIANTKVVHLQNAFPEDNIEGGNYSTTFNNYWKGIYLWKKGSGSILISHDERFAETEGNFNLMKPLPNDKVELLCNNNEFTLKVSYPSLQERGLHVLASCSGKWGKYALAGIDTENSSLIIKKRFGKAYMINFQELYVFEDEKMSTIYLKYLTKDLKMKRGFKKDSITTTLQDAYKNKKDVIFKEDDLVKFASSSKEKPIGQDPGLAQGFAKIMGIKTDKVCFYGGTKEMEYDIKILDKAKKASKKEYTKMQNFIRIRELLNIMKERFQQDLKDDDYNLSIIFRQLINGLRAKDRKRKRFFNFRKTDEKALNTLIEIVSDQISLLEDNVQVNNARLIDKSLVIQTNDLFLEGCLVCDIDIIEPLRKRLLTKKVNLGSFEIIIDLEACSVIINEKFCARPYLKGQPPHAEGSRGFARLCLGEMDEDVRLGFVNMDFNIIFECVVQALTYINGGSTYRDFDDWFRESLYKQWCNTKTGKEIVKANLDGKATHSTRSGVDKIIT